MRGLAWLLSVAAVVCVLATQVVAADPPEVPREFRAAWIATVANIDWPSQPGLSVADQKQELIKLLDLAVDLKLNGIVLQVRPACDAFYPSRLEPWSPFLTGKMGEVPDPKYDPLKFAVDEAHSRGLELHAWFNPYRASHPSMKGEFSSDHISRTHPELVREYGEYLWLDPGEPGAVQHSLDVIMDVVKRYDVDGVHFDDYFYPYPINDKDGKRVDFPDEASWQKYIAGLNGKKPLSRDDWRRQNVDQFLERLSAEIHQEKPWVRFGVSPFGIYRPGQPAGIQGFDSYANLYADSLKWLRDGTVDYFSPQLYWPIAQKAQSYPVLLKYWHEQNAKGRNLWPGNFTSRIDDGSKTEWTADELVNQVEATRAQEGATGNIHFSIKALASDRGGVSTKLKETVYADPALVPASPWLASQSPKPSKPKLSWSGRDKDESLVLRTATGPKPWLWVVQVEQRGNWTTHIFPGHTKNIAVDGAEAVIVSGVNRIGIEGPPSTIRPESKN